MSSNDLKPDAEHLTAIEKAQSEAEARNIGKEIGRDHRLTAPVREALMEAVRLRLAQLAKSAKMEHFGKDGWKPEKETEPSGSTLAAVSAPPKAPLGHALKDLVEAEVIDGEPASLVVREPAMPVIDPARLGVAMKYWQQLAKVIEDNTPECITIIQGKPFRNSEFWRAARLAYGIDRPTTESERIDFAAGRATITVRVNMGRRYASATGVCERAEKGKADAPMNTIQALAWTRAANRATRECIGLGSKSAEEVDAQ